MERIEVIIKKPEDFNLFNFFSFMFIMMGLLIAALGWGNSLDGAIMLVVIGFSLLIIGILIFVWGIKSQ